MFLGRVGGRAAQATERAGRAVSQESTTPNLKSVRRIVAALNRRDFEGSRSAGRGPCKVRRLVFYCDRALVDLRMEG
jgi:hypothetical protein